MTAHVSQGVAGGSADGAAVRALISDAVIEVIPLKNVDEKLRVVPRGTTINVTCSAKLGLARTLDCAVRAAEAGFHVIPHLAARQLTDEAELQSFVARMADAGLTELYLIGGDAPQSGPFDSSLQVLEALQHVDHGLHRIGVACYPEGHPNISDAALAEALIAKQPYAAYMVSQLCFSPDVLVAWLRRLREAGVTLPLHLGLAAPLQIWKLLELSPQLGVGSSVRYLAKQRGLIGSVLKGSAYRPESLLFSMGDALASPELQLEQLHLFSFNQVEATVQWQQNVASDLTTAVERS